MKPDWPWIGRSLSTCPVHSNEPIKICTLPHNQRSVTRVGTEKVLPSTQNPLLTSCCAHKVKLDPPSVNSFSRQISATYSTLLYPVSAHDK